MNSPDFSELKSVKIVLYLRPDGEHNCETLGPKIVQPISEPCGMNLQFDLNLVIGESGRRLFENPECSPLFRDFLFEGSLIPHATAQNVRKVLNV